LDKQFSHFACPGQALGFFLLVGRQIALALAPWASE